MRLAVLSLIAAPYWESLYRRLEREQGLTLRVFYLQTRDSLRGWSDQPAGSGAVQLRCLTPERWYPLPLIGVVNRSLAAHLDAFRPDCLLLHGYSYLTHLQAVRWAIRTGTPYLLWGDSNSHSLGARGLRAVLKRTWLRYFCRHAAAVLTIGSLNEAFWSHYGAEPGRRFLCPLAVDNDYFASQAAIWRDQKQAQRQQLGLPPGRLLLYTGRFVAHKNLYTLLQAFALRNAAAAPLSLALVGDGPERTRLRGLIDRWRLHNVALFGFQRQAELPRFYGVADALVLPSTYEPWGLAVNEAMASGLPVLLSSRTGCRPDLLEEGANGFSFDETQPQAVAACLDRFARLAPEELARMSARSVEKISGWTQAHTLSGLAQALRAVEARAPRP